MKNTTLADIVLSAQAAANEAFHAADDLQRQKIKLEKFELAEHDRADFPAWESSFNAQLEMLGSFARQDSPATRAARLAGSPGLSPSPAATNATHPSNTPSVPNSLKAVLPTMAIRALVILTAIFSLFFAAPAAKAQIFASPMVVTGLVSAAIQTSYQITSNTVAVPIQQHTLLMTNVYTNFSYVISYGALPVGQTGSNIVTCSTLTTNFTAAWTVATFGYVTNQFAWVYPVGFQYIYPGFVPWGSVTCWTNPTGILFQ